MRSAPTAPIARGVHAAGEIGLVHLLMRMTPEDIFDRQPWRGASGSVIAADLRLDNRDELPAALGLDPGRRGRCRIPRSCSPPGSAGATPPGPGCAGRSRWRSGTRASACSPSPAIPSASTWSCGIAPRPGSHLRRCPRACSRCPMFRASSTRRSSPTSSCSIMPSTRPRSTATSSACRRHMSPPSTRAAG